MGGDENQCVDDDTGLRENVMLYDTTCDEIKGLYETDICQESYFLEYCCKTCSAPAAAVETCDLAGFISRMKKKGLTSKKRFTEETLEVNMESPNIIVLLDSKGK